jgi:predicted nuclease with TOPRIM domain
MQALALSRNRAAKRAMEVAQHAHVSELERANAELREELKQAQIKIAEVEKHRDSLCSGYEKLENECESLHNVTETLKQEKTKAKRTYEAEVAMIRTKFKDYCMHHHKRLHDLHFNLEKMMNEFDTRCLPYLRKGSTIGDIVRWFDEEI